MVSHECGFGRTDVRVNEEGGLGHTAMKAMCKGRGVCVCVCVSVKQVLLEARHKLHIKPCENQVL